MSAFKQSREEVWFRGGAEARRDFAFGRAAAIYSQIKKIAADAACFLRAYKPLGPFA